MVGSQWQPGLLALLSLLTISEVRAWALSGLSEVNVKGSEVRGLREGTRVTQGELLNSGKHLRRTRGQLDRQSGGPMEGM